eukprot:IDg5139t1
MSLLDGSHTPCAMFQQDVSATGANQEAMKTFMLFQSGNGSRFEQARERLRFFGLLEGGDDAMFASNIAQALPDPVPVISRKETSNLALLFRGSNDTNWVALVIGELFEVIKSKFYFSEREYGLDLVQRLQNWTPCVQHLVEAFLEPWKRSSSVTTCRKMLSWTCSRLPRNENLTSESIAQVLVRVASISHANKISSWSNSYDLWDTIQNLAKTYSALAKHSNALKLRDDTFALCTNVLPEDNQQIAASMGDLAIATSALGRHLGALELLEKTVALRTLILPGDHQDIAASMSNLAITYTGLGRHSDALNAPRRDISASQAHIAGRSPGH